MNTCRKGRMMVRWVGLAALLLVTGEVRTQGLPGTRVPEDPVVRITRSLVRIDAMVTDKSGHPVRGLTRDDFQILQDGEPQELTSFNAVALPAPAVAPLQGPSTCSSGTRRGRWKGPNSESDPLVIHNGITRSQVQRTLAIAVEKPEWIACEAIERTVRQKLTDRDLTAIVTLAAYNGIPRGHNGIYEQFTNNRQLLAEAALDWWNSLGRRTPDRLALRAERMAQAVGRGVPAPAPQGQMPDEIEALAPDRHPSDRGCGAGA